MVACSYTYESICSSLSPKGIVVIEVANQEVSLEWRRFVSQVALELANHLLHPLTPPILADEDI